MTMIFTPNAPRAECRGSAHRCQTSAAGSDALAAARRFRPRVVADARDARRGRRLRRGGQLAAEPHARQGSAARAARRGERMEPVALARLPGAADWTSLRYRPVVATGEYMARWQILIDNKVVGGRAGFHVVTPLALADGRVVLVNRGWVAQGASRAALPDVPPPAGTVIGARTHRDPGGRLSRAAAGGDERTGLAEPRPGALRRGDRHRRAAGRHRSDRGTRRPTTGSSATGRRRISGSTRTGSTWCSGTRSPLLAFVLWLWFNRPRSPRGERWLSARRPTARVAARRRTGRAAARCC